MSIFDSLKSDDLTEVETTTAETPVVAPSVPTEVEVDVVKLAKDKQTLAKKVADWEDKILEAVDEVETAKQNMCCSDPSEYKLEEAEADLKLWKNAQAKVERLTKNLETYRKMFEDAAAALRAAV